MRILLSIIPVFLLLTASAAIAMPLDGFLSAHPERKRSPSLNLEAGYDFTTDTVDHSPNTANGQHLPPVSQKRFEGGHLGGQVQVTPRLSFDGYFWRRKVVSLRDSYSLSSIQGAVQYLLPGGWHNTHFAVRASIGSNYSEAFDKNSYTRYGGYLFTSASVHDPKDQQLQLNLIATHAFFNNYEGTIFTGIGQSKVGFSWLEGKIRNKDGCQYRFTYSRGIGELEQLARCGSVTRMRMKLPTDESIKNQIGLEPRKALEYESSYWQVGGNIRWTHHNWQARLGYFFQRYDRGDLDMRIKATGTTSSTDNHTLQTGLKYHINRKLSIFLRSEYMSNRLLNMVPFTYNRYTASKFGKSGLLFFTGLTLTL